jgi:hypothetical protein
VPESEQETAPGPSAPDGKVSSYERELMSLGLGELPPELLHVAPIASAKAVRPAARIRREPRPSDLATDGEIVTPLPAADSKSAGDEAIDLSALLESLDQANDEASPASSPAESGEQRPSSPKVPDEGILADAALLESASAEIPTDSYMEEMSLDTIALSGGMTDELSALTGADRPARPVVNVSGIPDGPLGVLKRDTNVDRDTLLRIIDGIKSL